MNRVTNLFNRMGISLCDDAKTRLSDQVSAMTDDVNEMYV